MPFFSARPTQAFSVRAKRGRLPFLTRQIITTGYVAAGYKDSVTWRNVNKVNHSTDISSNLGDLLQAATNYTNGAHNNNVAFIWGTNGTGTEGGGAFTNTSCFNMRNDTTYTKTPAMNTAQTVGNSGVVMEMNDDGTYTYSWQTGNQGAAVWQKFNLTTEAHQSTIATAFGQGGTGSAAHFGETFGYIWNDSPSAADGRRKFVYATETESTPSILMGWYGQQRGMSSKVGKGWAGNEGGYDGGNAFRVTDYATETMSTNVAKPITNCGEENLDMGQAHQYMLGMYNGAQTNRAWRFNYATQAGFEGGASMQPTGTATGTGATGGCCPSGQIGGRSSGASYWRN